MDEEGLLLMPGLRHVFSGSLALLLLLHPTMLRASCGAEDCPLTLRGTHGAGQPFSFDLSYQYIDQDRIQIGTHSGAVGELPSPEDEVRTVSRTATALGQMRLSDRLGLTASLPMIDRSHTHIANEEGGPSVLRHWNYSGLGDLTLLGQFQVLGAGHSTVLSVQIGARLPTGRRHVDAVDGDEPEPPARPGTGSFDGLAGFHLMRMVSLRGFGQRTSEVPLFASVLGRVNGRGTEEYRLGNELQVNLGGSYPLTPALQILAQVNGRFRGMDDPGRTDALRDNTGGTWIYGSPGLRVQIAPAIAAYGYVQLPVYERVNRIQLVAPSHWVFGTTYSLGR
jgi:hypothetical protein